MNDIEFKNLKYGNVIARNADGAKFSVTHTMRDAAGNVTAATLIPAIDAADAAAYSVVDKSYSETALQGRTILGE